MKRIKSLEDLQRFRAEITKERQDKANHGVLEVIVSLGNCGIAAGALDVLHTVEDQIRAHHLDEITVSQTGCIGLCSHEPILQVIVGNTSKVTYGKVNPHVVKRIFQEHVLDGGIVDEYVIDATPFPTI